MPRREGAHAAPSDVPYQLWEKKVIGSGKKFAAVPSGGGNRYFYEEAKFKVLHGDKRLTVTAQVTPDLNTLSDDGTYFWGVKWPEYEPPKGDPQRAFRNGGKVTGRAAAKAAAEGIVKAGRKEALALSRGPVDEEP